MRVFVNRRASLPWQLDDIPDILNSIAEFSTCYASTQAVIAYADGVVLEAVGEVVVAFGHCTDKNADALFGSDIRYVVFHPNDVGVKTEGDLAAIGRKMISDRILDDFEEFLL